LLILNPLCLVELYVHCDAMVLNFIFPFGCRVLSLDSLGERRGLVLNFSDLQKLLNGCSQLEVYVTQFRLLAMDV
jgi:hypothetical protein